MAPRVRVAHSPKYAPIQRKVPFDPVSESFKRKFIEWEAKEVKSKKQKTTHVKKNTVPKPTVKSVQCQTTNTQQAQYANYNRTFESRTRCLPEFVENKISSLIEYVQSIPKRKQPKVKIFPIKGIYRNYVDNDKTNCQSNVRRSN